MHGGSSVVVFAVVLVLVLVLILFLLVLLLFAAGCPACRRVVRVLCVARIVPLAYNGRRVIGSIAIAIVDGRR